MHEDGLKIVRGYVLDAIWISDNTVVTMKKINLSKHSLEVDICHYFSSEPRANDPANHCVPVYEVLDVPDNSDRKILVMPLLRKFTSPRFFTSGEAVELVRQVLDGKLDLSGWAKFYHRTNHPVKYYFMDFGLFCKYNPGKDRGEPCDPFPTDIYYLGNAIRTELLESIIDGMVQDEPANRPSMDQVDARFDLLLGSLSTWKLRVRLAFRREIWLIRIVRVVQHTFRIIYYVLTRRPALPRPLNMIPGLVSACPV
ncbi:hypothetical protein C2E23DRAFT_872898 [Lenzites betulinus]|nr:hypothetical protein C2E23DRAFT_872898 [Lenzites betulinus]